MEVSEIVLVFLILIFLFTCGGCCFSYFHFYKPRIKEEQAREQRRLQLQLKRQVNHPVPGPPRGWFLVVLGGFRDKGAPKPFSDLCVGGSEWF